MKNWNERLRYVLDLKNISDAEIARVAGVSAPSVNQWFGKGSKKQTTQLTAENAVRICRYLSINIEWFLFGTPPMESDGLVRYVSDRVSDGFLRLELLDVHAAAGPGAEPVDYPQVVEHIEVLETWARQSLGIANPDRVKVITCHGDSMTPTIQPGDVVFVDTKTRHFEADGVYVLIWQGRLLIKRLRALMDGRIAIQSDNQTGGYGTEYVSASQADSLSLCGKALGWWTLRKF